MQLFFDRQLVIEEVKAGLYFFYSPLLGEWFKGDETAKTLIEEIIKSEGNIDPRELETKLRLNRSVSESVRIDALVKKLLQTPLFFSSEERYKAALLEFKKEYEISPDQRLEIAYLHPTHRCNYACVYCYNGRVSKGNTEELSTGAWINIIEELKKEGLKTFVFTGGEPLLRKDLHKMISKAKEGDKEHCVIILTNGSVLTEDRIEELLPLVDRFVLSIDSTNLVVHETTRNSFGFSTIKNAIALLGNHAPEKIRTRSVLTSHNLHDTLKTIQILREQYNVPNHEVALRLPNTVEEINLIPDISKVESIEEGMLTLEPKELILHGKVRCGAATKVIAVDMRGDIYPCQSLLEENEFRLGNMLKDGWYSTLLSSHVREIFRNLSVDNREVHKRCPYRYLCGGGCPAIAWRLYKRLDAFLPFLCDHNKLSAKKRMILHKVEKI